MNSSDGCVVVDDNGVIIMGEFGTNKVISYTFFSRLNATKMVLVPSILLVLWLIHRMLKLFFTVLVIH